MGIRQLPTTQPDAAGTAPPRAAARASSAGHPDLSPHTGTEDHHDTDHDPDTSSYTTHHNDHRLTAHVGLGAMAAATGGGASRRLPSHDACPP
ncbi:MAG: hypothetical protein ACRDTD_31110, partial [Pseudonocardiaceae bacterium]